MSVTPIGVAPNILKLAGKYLENRGLTIAEAYQYGIQVLPAAPIYEFLNWSNVGVLRHVGGLWVPHWDPSGRQYPGVGHAILFCAAAFGNVEGKIDKYSVVGRNSPSFTRLGHNWSEIEEGATVIICESVIKASVVHKVMGWPTVALNGVEGWSTGNKQPHPDLISRTFWADKRVIVLFDSLSTTNARSRANVIRARETVEDIVTALGGAELLRAELPEIEGQWGVDDFVVARGPEALNELLMSAVAVEADDVSPAARQMTYLNKHYGVLRHPVRVVSVDDPRHLWSFSDFENLYQNHTIRHVNAAGRVANIAIAKLWYSHESRRNVSRLFWRPGEDRISPEGLNLWGGFGVEAARDEGRARKFWYATLMKALGPEGKHLVNLLAALVQQPGRKIGWYVYLHGKPGTGKNYLMEPLKHIFGGHYVSMSVEGYLNKFNSALSAARVIVFSEMPEYMDRALVHKFEEELKIESDTAPHMRLVEPKGAEKIHVERHASVFMFSNHHPFFRVGRGDRRGLFLSMSEEMRPAQLGGSKTEKYWSDRWEWMGREGPAEVMRFLLDWEIDWAAMPALPPETEYRSRLIGASEINDMSAVLEDWLRAPPEGLEDVVCIRATDLIQLAYGPMAPECGEHREVVRAGRYLELCPKLKQFRVRIGGKKVRFSVKSGVTINPSLVENNFSLWSKHWATPEIR
jgi:hypothetical protein